MEQLAAEDDGFPVDPNRGLVTYSLFFPDVPVNVINMLQTTVPNQKAYLHVREIE